MKPCCECKPTSLFRNTRRVELFQTNGAFLIRRVSCLNDHRSLISPSPISSTVLLSCIHKFSLIYWAGNRRLGSDESCSISLRSQIIPPTAGLALTKCLVQCNAVSVVNGLKGGAVVKLQEDWDSPPAPAVMKMEGA